MGWKVSRQKFPDFLSPLLLSLHSDFTTLWPHGMGGSLRGFPVRGSQKPRVSWSLGQEGGLPAHRPGRSDVIRATGLRGWLQSGFLGLSPQAHCCLPW